MHKNISENEYKILLNYKKKTIKAIIYNIPIFLIISAFICLFIQDLNIGLLISFILMSIFLTIIFIKIKKVEEKIKYYKEQSYIEEENKEIKSLLNKFNKLLNTLNLEKSRIDYNINKYINQLSYANTLNDFKKIKEFIKDDIRKYSELLDENFEKEKYNNYIINSTNNEILKNLQIFELRELPKTKKELKNIYRILLKKYHPDNIKLLSTNMTEKEIEQKAAQINVAYDFLIKMYN